MWTEDVLQLAMEERAVSMFSFSTQLQIKVSTFFRSLLKIEN
jgi:hypothetical protein